jgi:CHAT domain-containing protein
VSLPAASVFAIQRRELANRKPATRQLALFADPVFEQDDERVKAIASIVNRQDASVKPEMASSQPARPESERSDFERAVRESGIRDQRSKIERLPFSREEANAIFALVQRAHALKALDFEANKKTATGEGIGQYRIVHFATHALLNNEHPELSGIVLSLVDRQGHRIDGFLRLNEIYNLNLPADLVVLSACQTGLGRQIKGEGLIGLTRGFLYAGAERVVASLWSVDDEATAELMRRFYSKFLQEDQPVSAALRQAQMEMSAQKRWSNAYYWAAFEMQGEWK